MHYGHSCRRGQSHPPHSVAWLHGGQVSFTVTAFVRRSRRHHPIHHFSNTLSWTQLRLEHAYLDFSYNIFSFCYLLSLLTSFFFFYYLVSLLLPPSYSLLKRGALNLGLFL